MALASRYRPPFPSLSPSPASRPLSPSTKAPCLRHFPGHRFLNGLTGSCYLPGYIEKSQRQTPTVGAKVQQYSTLSHPLGIPLKCLEVIPVKTI